jgi:eps11P family protein
MFVCTDKRKADEYQSLMFELKKKNQDSFFSASWKRKMLRPFLQFKITRPLFERITPYSYEDIKKDIDYFSNSRIAIYTAVYGGYDACFEPRVKPDNCDYFIFTDGVVNEKDSSWRKKEVVFPGFDMLSNAQKNRFVKMHPHLLFPDYDYSIYIDGNIEVVTDFTEFIQEFNEYGVKFHIHFNRHCAYDEIDECIRQKKSSIEQLENYRKKLLEEGFPHNFGLLEAPVICRRHHLPVCKTIMERWWNEYLNDISRDQLALVYVLYHMKINLNKLGGLGRDIHSNYAFIQHSHKQQYK